MEKKKRARLTKQDRAMLAAVINAAENMLRGRTAEQTRAALISAARAAGCEYLQQLDALRAKITP